MEGDSKISGVRIELGKPGGFLFTTDSVSLNASIYLSLVFQFGTVPHRPALKV